MRVILVSCLLFASLVFARPDEKSAYTTRYDNIDIKQIMDNPRLYRKYSKCLLNEGLCAWDARGLKGIVPEVLEDGCAKCSEKQKVLLKEAMIIISTEHPEDLKKLREIYDKDGKYAKKYEELAKKYNIKLS